MKLGMKTAALCLVLALLCGLCACGVRPVRSTAEEATPIVELGSYTVPYELYRYVFLMQKRAVDNGNAAFWDTADKEAYFATFDEAARAEILRVYSLFSLAEAAGLQPFGRAVTKQVKERLNEMVGEGCVYADRDAYLAGLQSNYMNDSLSRLYLRYDICLEMLIHAYLVEGKLDVSEDEALTYYDSENCVFVRWIYRPYSYEEYLVTHFNGDRQAAKAAMAEELASIRTQAAVASDEEFTALAHQYFQDMYNDKEIERGFVVGKYEYSSYYDALTEACFALEEGETSGIVEAGDGYYILRRFEKPHYFSFDEDGMSAIVASCRNDMLYRLLAAEAERLEETAVYTDFYEQLEFDTVQMTKE